MKRIFLLLVAGILVFAGLAAAQPVKKPQKTAICHATGSTTNPYVKISVNANQLRAHRGHARDIIPAPASGCPGHLITPSQGGVELRATMTGAAEVPGPGDPDGTGTATVRLLAGLGYLCYALNVDKITLPATGAHIHLGAAGVAGDVVVPLQAPKATAPNATTGASSGCVNASRTIVAAILASPSGYYVNVHTTDFPNGAIRGQLAAA